VHEGSADAQQRPVEVEDDRVDRSRHGKGGSRVRA
jgi:hypothetical protein